MTDTPTEQQQDQRNARAWWPALAGLGVLALALRLAGIGSEGLWYDEAVTAGIVTESLRSVFLGLSRDNGNPPGHSLLLWFWARTFGFGEVGLRSLSAVLGAASAPLLALVAQRVTCRRQALWAGLLLAISPFGTYYSQEARAYATVLFWALVSMLALQRATERPSRGRWLLAAAAGFAVAYTHYFGAFVLAAQGLWLWSAGRDRRRNLVTWFGWMLAVAAAYAYWLPVLRMQMGAGSKSSAGDLTWLQHLVSTPLVFSVGRTLIWKELVDGWRIALACLALFGFGWPAMAGLASIWPRRSERWLLVPWLLLPLAAAAPVQLYRVHYGIVALPAYLILVAVGLGRLRPRAMLVCVGLIAATTSASLATLYLRPQRHDWRRAAELVAARQVGGDVVVVQYDFGVAPMLHYLHGVPVLGLAGVDETGRRLLAHPGRGLAPLDVTDALEASRQVWLVIFDDAFADPATAAIEQCLESAFGAPESFEPHRLRIRLYRRVAGAGERSPAG